MDHWGEDKEVELMTLPKKPNSLVKERSDDSFKEAEATTGPLDTFFFIY